MGARGPWTGWVLRLFVAGIFLFAAVGKALAPTELLEALTSLGVPDPLLWPAAILLLAAELAVAVLLLRACTESLGTMLAMGLSAGFLAVTAYRLHRGSPESCACFGLFLTLRPIETIRLDFALLAACALLLWHGGGQAPRAVRTPGLPLSSLVPRRWLGYTAIWAAALWLLFQVGLGRWERARAEEAARPMVERLHVGDTAPTGLREPGAAGRWGLYAFVDPACGACGAWLRELGRGLSSAASAPFVQVLVPVQPSASSGARAAERYARRVAAGLPVRADLGGRLAAQCLDDPATWPFAVVTDGAGVVRAIARRGRPEVGELLQGIDEAAADVPLDGSRSRAILHGRRVLDREIQTLRGAVRLSGLWHPGPLVVVFVDPGCGTCWTSLQAVGEAVGAVPAARTLAVVPSRAAASEVAPRLPAGGYVTWQWEELDAAYGLGRATVLVLRGGRVQLVAAPPIDAAAVRRAVAISPHRP